MSNLLNPKIKLASVSAEIKSFIYQQVQEFNPYITEETIVSIIAKDPLKLAHQYETDDRQEEIHDLKKMYRIAIILKENDAKLAEEGVAENIYEAIRMAKDKLLVRLQAIQDRVVSKQERIQQIQYFLSNPQVH